MRSRLDSLNRLGALMDPDSNRTTLQYDAGGQRTTMVDANGVTRAYQYDGAGRPTTQVDYNSGMSPIYTLVDGYDNAGNRTTREQNGNRWTWVYDAADQLLQQLRSGYRGTYTYDEVGNITLKDHQGYSPITMTFDAANRLATAQRGATPVTLTYDAVGNLTVDNANGNRVTYAYDPENRLISMHNYTGSRYTYAYWADGLRRYAQEPSSPIVTQIWDGQDLLMEKSPTGTARYIAHEGEVFGEERGDTRYLYLPDPLGSVVALLDNAQTITDSFIYLPYGEEQSRTGSTASYLRWLGRWGYRRDYTNRAYVRARVMRTDFGKLMTEDPLGFGAGDVNLYRYVGGNPMTDVDPSGQQVFDCFVLGPPVGIQHRFISTDMCGAFGFAGSGGWAWESGCRDDDEFLARTRRRVWRWIYDWHTDSWEHKAVYVGIPGRPGAGNVHCTEVHATRDQERRLCQCMGQSCASPPWYSIIGSTCIDWVYAQFVCAGILNPAPPALV